MFRMIVILASLAAVPALATEPLEKFGWFSGVVGACWQGTFPDGKTRHTHCYTVQFGQFIRGTATLSAERDGVMRDVFSGDSLFAWDDKDQKIAYYVWGSDGTHGTHEAHYEGRDLSFPVLSKKEPGKVAFRSLWRRVDGDSFEVHRQVPEGSGWTTELTVVYMRVPEG